MKFITDRISRGGGKISSYLAAAFLALVAMCAASPARAVDAVDLEGATTTVSDAGTTISQYVGKEVRNGTITTTAQQGAWTEGTYYFGDGFTLSAARQVYFSGVYTLNLLSGSTIDVTGTEHFYLPFRYGTAVLDMTGGTLKTSSSAAIYLGYAWNNQNSTSSQNITTDVSIANGSVLDSAGDIQIGGASKTSGTWYKPATVNINAGVTNSTFKTAGQIVLGSSTAYMTTPASSATTVSFGPGADITCLQIYTRRYPAPAVMFDGATIHYGGSTASKSFIGAENSSARNYTIGSNGLTVDIPSGVTLTLDKNSADLKGTGGIVKTGEGSLVWSKLNNSDSTGALSFTGALVVSNGTWTSANGYAASAVRADGGTLVLSGALSASDIALAATEGGTLTLSGATLTDASPSLELAGGGSTDYFTRDGAVASYTLDSLTIGEGAVLDLDAAADGTFDTINATTTNIAATASSQATVNLNVAATPSAGTKYTLLETDDADKFTVNLKVNGVALSGVTVSLVDGKLTATVLGPDYIWNDGNSGASWTAAGKWLYAGSAAAWSDGNNAIFNSDGDSATVDSAVTAGSLEFNGNATVSGAATLTVPAVSVASGKTATVSAPTAGTLEKTGAGTLTLGTSRTEQTTVSEGTLAMASGATLDGTKLTLGTDAAKSVALDYGGQTLSQSSQIYLGSGMDVTLTNGTFNFTSSVAFTDANLPATFTIAKDAVLSDDDRFTINTSTSRTMNIDGGEFVAKASNNNWIMQASTTGTLNIDVSNQGLMEFNGNVNVMTCRDGSAAYVDPCMNWVFNDSDLHVFADSGTSDLSFGYDTNNKNPQTPQFTLAMTNSELYVDGTIHLGHNTAGTYTTGFYKAGFKDTTIYAEHFHVHSDRPLNNVDFDGADFVALDDGDMLIQQDAASDAYITVGAGGLTLDNNGYDVTVGANLKSSDASNPGTVVSSGEGTTTYTLPLKCGALKVCGGTVAISSGNAIECPVSICQDPGYIYGQGEAWEGATLSVAGGHSVSGAVAAQSALGTIEVTALSASTPTITAASYDFSNGVTLSVPNPGQGTYPVLALSSGTMDSSIIDDITLVCPVAAHLAVSGANLNLVVTGAAVPNTGITSLAVDGETVVTGAGGVKLSTLEFAENSTLTIDPIFTPVLVSATPVFGTGSKIALSSDYSSMSCGRIVLMTYSGNASFDQTLFDSTSIASGATYTLAEETAPDGTNMQLVLTVGDYANAPEIRILPIGDSITQGVTKDSQGDYPQYRTEMAALLAARGYKPVMKGIWHYAQDDAAGVQQPDEYKWHCGVSGDAIIQNGYQGGVRDNLHVYVDIAGEPDALTLLIGTNDIGNGGMTAQETYDAYLALVTEIAAELPRTKIIGSTILEAKASGTAHNTAIKDFNTLLESGIASGAFPANYTMIDLFTEVPLSGEGNFFADKLHPNWKGQALIARNFASAIETALPLSTYAGPIDDTLTDVAQTAQGAAANIPAAYLSGMTHVFTIDGEANNRFAAGDPYTAKLSNAALSRTVKKAGYYMELVRKGTSRRRYIWVDCDADGKTLDQIDFPWTGDTMNGTVSKLHVYSNDPSIHNIAADDDTITGIVEGTRQNYDADDDDGSLPSDMGSGTTYGWNDTLDKATSGYGCFQMHRIFSQEGADTHWNDAEVLFAWNNWGERTNSKINNDELGIGTFFTSKSFGTGYYSTDYTFVYNIAEGGSETMDASAYQVRHLEIWAELGEPVHGVWSGNAGDTKFTTVSNWDDGVVPSLASDTATTLDFSEAASSPSVTDIPADLPTFAGIDTGSNVVTFAGENPITFAAISDTSKIAVGQNSTVVLDDDLVFESSSSTRYIVNTVATGGKFVVTGQIKAMSTQTGGVLPCVTVGGGAIQAKGLYSDIGDDKWGFRLNKSSASGSVIWEIGEAGLSAAASKGFWMLANSSSANATIRPLTNDLSIAAWIGNRSGPTLTIDTTGADGEAYTVTIGSATENDSGLQEGGGILREAGVVVAGTGKVVCAYDVTKNSPGQTAYSNAFSVRDTATLELGSSAYLGTGQIEIRSGATLSLPDSGTAAYAAGGQLHFGVNGDNNGSKLALAGLSCNAAAITATTYTIYHGTGTTVTLGSQPGIGEYPVITITGSQTLTADHASRLHLDTTGLDTHRYNYAFSKSDDGKSIVLTVSRAASGMMILVR